MGKASVAEHEVEHEVTPIESQQQWLAKLLQDDESSPMGRHRSRSGQEHGRHRSHSGQDCASSAATPRAPRWSYVAPQSPRLLLAGVRKQLTRVPSSLPRVHVDCKFASTPRDLSYVLTWSDAPPPAAVRADVDEPRPSIESVEWDPQYWEADVQKIIQGTSGNPRSLWAKLHRVRAAVGPARRASR